MYDQTKVEIPNYTQDMFCQHQPFDQGTFSNSKWQAQKDKIHAKAAHHTQRASKVVENVTETNGTVHCTLKWRMNFFVHSKKGEERGVLANPVGSKRKACFSVLPPMLENLKLPMAGLFVSVTAIAWFLA